MKDATQRHLVTARGAYIELDSRGQPLVAVSCDKGIAPRLPFAAWTHSGGANGAHRPFDTFAVVDRGVTLGVTSTDIQHAVLGAVDRVVVTSDTNPAATVDATIMSHIEWRALTHIPAIDKPFVLPPGIGSLFLNAIAMLAKAEGIPSLQYAGAYPTSGLFGSLMQCFATSASESDFSLGAWDLAVAGQAVVSDVVWKPTPFDHWYVEPDVRVVAREHIESVQYKSQRFTRNGANRKLVREGEQMVGTLHFSELPFLRVFTLDERGDMLTHFNPQWHSAVLGKNFPPQLQNMLYELVRSRLPDVPEVTALADIILQRVNLVWADTGLVPAQLKAENMFLHAGIWECYRDRGTQALLEAIVDALEPALKTALAKLEHERGRQSSGNS